MDNDRKLATLSGTLIQNAALLLKYSNVVIIKCKQIKKYDLPLIITFLFKIYTLSSLFVCFNIVFVGF